MTNIRGRTITKATYQGKLPNKKILPVDIEILNKIPFDESLKELKDCFDCEGCLCEDLCKKEGDSFEGQDRE